MDFRFSVDCCNQYCETFDKCRSDILILCDVRLESLFLIKCNSSMEERDRERKSLYRIMDEHSRYSIKKLLKERERKSNELKTPYWI